MVLRNTDLGGEERCLCRQAGGHTVLAGAAQSALMTVGFLAGAFLLLLAFLAGDFLVAADFLVAVVFLAFGAVVAVVFLAAAAFLGAAAFLATLGLLGEAAGLVVSVVVGAAAAGFALEGAAFRLAGAFLLAEVVLVVVLAALVLAFAGDLLGFLAADFLAIAAPALGAALALGFAAVCVQHLDVSLLGARMPGASAVLRWRAPRWRQDRVWQCTRSILRRSETYLFGGGLGLADRRGGSLLGRHGCTCEGGRHRGSQRPMSGDDLIVTAAVQLNAARGVPEVASQRLAQIFPFSSFPCRPDVPRRDRTTVVRLAYLAGTTLCVPACTL